MKIKALTSFCGKVSMFASEVREVADEIGRDLVRAGHAVEVEAEKAKALAGKKAKAKAEANPVENPVEKAEETPAEPVEKAEK